MSSAHVQPNPVAPGGAFSAENTPQVVVRAGKTYVCSACGTLVEIPADVVGQLVIAVTPEAENKPVDAASEEQEPGRTEAAQEKSSPSHPVTAEVCTRPSTAKTTRPSRPGRPKQPKRVSFADEMIDGLRVPTAGQLDRALAWVSFHLKVLDRQGSEIKRLRKLLKQRSTIDVPRPSLTGRAQKATREGPSSRVGSARQRHAPADLSVAPDVDNKTQRGPP
ncbi:hypothetical protein [Bremerella sp. P1]|uniref:hypothetical protein n=1 Tax=Bremerella sp. P1 TaxID=3026424 RepID=UPI002368D335|nr:hypothetical protein [Bremerella sp. P1]WDI44611.1 hypothetical protein PSR63_11765 [Bremerella sp. P1]